MCRCIGVIRVNEILVKRDYLDLRGLEENGRNERLQKEKVGRSMYTFLNAKEAKTTTKSIFL